MPLFCCVILQCLVEEGFSYLHPKVNWTFEKDYVPSTALFENFQSGIITSYFKWPYSLFVKALTRVLYTEYALLNYFCAANFYVREEQIYKYFFLV